MKKLPVILVILILATRLLAQSNAPVRLALIAETDEASGAADVLTAQLSGNPQIQLLERNEIEKVYREQALSAGNKDYLKLGRLLGADGLLLLGTVNRGANQFLEARLVAVKPGVVIEVIHWSWPVTNVTQWAKQTAGHFGPFIPKLGVLAKDAIPISLVNLHSALGSSEAREMERQLTILAIERLAWERQLFVLERRRMQLLVSEKGLQDMGESVFWDGSYLLDGIVDRDGYSRETITINARLLPPKGGAPIPIEVRGSRTNLSEVIGLLVNKVTETLKLGSRSEPWDPADEASQYYEEANWAFRWHLYEQAQAAGESAWALGRHTKDVAVLRVRAYGENVLPPENPSAQCNFDVPAVPDESKLKSACRALELFCRDAPRTATNPAALDTEWFDLGLQTLRMSARFLEGFYYTAEARRGNAEPLLELRSLTRQAAVMLRTGEPENRKINDHFLGGWRSHSVGSECNSLEWLIWEEGGIWQERPEDSLPAFKELLESGYHPSHLPRVIGWSWEDRKRAPHVLRTFIDGLCASTNPEVRLEGRFLALLRTPNDTEGVIDTCEERLFSEIWEQRRGVLDDPEKVSLLPRTEQALRDKKYLWSDPNRRLEDAPLIAFTHELRMDYLLNTSNYNDQVFCMLFPDYAEYYSQSDAREFLPLMEDFRGRTRLQKPKAFAFDSVVGQLQRIAGTNIVVVQRPRPLAVWPAENPLKVSFIEWKLKQLPIRTDLSPKPQKLILRGGKIWCRACYLQANELIPYKSPSAFLRVDINTGDCDEIPFPPEFGISDESFEVTEDSLFVSVQNRLARFRFRERTWETIPVPMEGGAEITALNGHLYLATRDSLLEVQPDTRTVQILASARRRPAANELDSLWGQGAQVFTGWSNKVGVLTTSCLFLFDLGKREWEKIALPESLPRQHVTPFLTGQGIQLLGWDYPALRGHVRMFGFSPDRAGPELLLKQGAGEHPPASGPGQLLDPPRWQWPEPFRLDFPSFVFEGQGLWALDPRIIHWSNFFGVEEPVTFSDNRQATLLRFEPGIRPALSLALRFEKDGQPVDPFDPQNGKFYPPTTIPTPFLLASDKGLIVACGKFPGHWLISKATLESRLNALRATLREDLGAGGAQASPSHSGTKQVSGIGTNSTQIIKP